MPSKKASITSRIRFDALYMVVALFAVIGGYTLLGSYADSKAPPTLKPGSYRLSNYRHDSQYLIDLKSGLTYCFSPYRTGASSATMTLAGQVQAVELLQQDTQTACFTASQDALKVAFNFGDSSPKTLRVK